jgi:hypothetical protein
MIGITWPYCIVYNCKNNCGALLNVPSTYQSSHSSKKIIFLVVEKIKILLFVAPLAHIVEINPRMRSVDTHQELSVLLMF